MSAPDVGEKTEGSVLSGGPFSEEHEFGMSAGNDMGVIAERGGEGGDEGKSGINIEGSRLSGGVKNLRRDLLV